MPFPFSSIKISNKKQKNKCSHRILSVYHSFFCFASYIFDFYCPIKKIAIEIDGSQHYTDEAIEYDKTRTNRLRKYGIEVIRFTNLDIKKHFIEVCDYIENILRDTSDKKNPQSPDGASPLVKGAKEPVSRHKWR